MQDQVNRTGAFAEVEAGQARTCVTRPAFRQDSQLDAARDTVPPNAPRATCRRLRVDRGDGRELGSSVRSCASRF